MKNVALGEAIATIVTNLENSGYEVKYTAVINGKLILRADHKRQRRSEALTYSLESLGVKV